MRKSSPQWRTVRRAGTMKIIRKHPFSTGRRIKNLNQAPPSSGNMQKEWTLIPCMPIEISGKEFCVCGALCSRSLSTLMILICILRSYLIPADVCLILSSDHVNIIVGLFCVHPLIADGLLECYLFIDLPFPSVNGSDLFGNGLHLILVFGFRGRGSFFEHTYSNLFSSQLFHVSRMMRIRFSVLRKIERR